MTRTVPVERVVADLRAPRPGATVVAVVGLHGNEPDPLRALTDFTAELESSGGLSRGRLCVLAGNVEALRRNQRYVHHDMNRVWTDERVGTLAERVADAANVEDAEQVELLHALDAVFEEGSSRRALLDFHTFSGEGTPFILGSDRAAHREMAEALNVPLVFGLQESLEGALSRYFDRRYDPCLAIEAGRTGLDTTRATVRRILGEILNRLDMARIPPSTAATDSAFSVYRVSYRHPISVDDEFRMEPGFSTLMKIESGQLLARDRRGEVLAPHDGRILMPLYQSVGSEGFFLVQKERNEA